MKKAFLLITAVTLFTPEAGAQQPIQTSASSGVRPAAFITYRLAFRDYGRPLVADYAGNAGALQSIAEKIRENAEAIRRGEYRIRVGSNVAPASVSAAQAREEARRRALVVKSHLIRSCGVRETDFITGVTTDGSTPSDDFLTVGIVPGGEQTDDTVVTKE